MTMADRWISFIAIIPHMDQSIPAKMQGFIAGTVILLVAVSGKTLFGQDPKMMQADSAFVEAVAKADKPVLEKLLDADFAWINTEGEVFTKARVIKELPRMAITSGRNAESKAYMYGELGNVQVNLGRAHALRVWVKKSASWQALVYQELMSLETPPAFTPGAGNDCENPCKTIAFTPRNEIEREVALAYSKLETAAHARNSAAFDPMVGDEFVAASSNSDKLQSKRSRMADFDRSKDGGVAPTPLLSAQMFSFGDAVLMISEHKPDRGRPLRVTRIWVKRAGNWVETLSYQTAVIGATFR
jgi:hypothetical protein